MKTIKIAYSFENRNLRNWLNEQVGLSTYAWPELNYSGMPIHPAKHQDYVRYILDVRYTLDSLGKAIITHSEHIILGLLLAVKRGELKPEQLEVYWVEDSGEALRLRVDSDGEFIDRWPHGFFDERMNLLFPDEENNSHV